jgi:hypothetical protein
MACELGNDEHQPEIKKGLERQQAAECKVEPLLGRGESGGNDNHRDRTGKQTPYPRQDPEGDGPVKTEEAENSFDDGSQKIVFL